MKKEAYTMNPSIMKKVSAVSELEKRILQGEKLNLRNFFSKDKSEVDFRRKAERGCDIALGTHTRFAEFPMHSHTGMEMQIVLSGVVTHRIGGEKITLTAGDIIVMNRHVFHSIDKTDLYDVGINVLLPDSFIDVISDDLKETVFAELLSEHNNPAGTGIYMCFSTAGNVQIENIIENSLYEWTNYLPDRKVLTYTIGLLFYYLSLKSDRLLTVSNRLPNRDTMRKTTVLDYVREHYSDGTLKDLSERMFLSAPYLSGLIASLFGKNFKQLLVDEKMKRAKNMICRTKIPIGDIIRSVGYENASYFHKEFRDRYGTTPLAVRKKAIEEEKANQKHE